MEEAAHAGKFTQVTSVWQANDILFIFIFCGLYFHSFEMKRKELKKIPMIYFNTMNQSNKINSKLVLRLRGVLGGCLHQSHILFSIGIRSDWLGENSNVLFDYTISPCSVISIRQLPFISWMDAGIFKRVVVWRRDKCCSVVTLIADMVSVREHPPEARN